jgi:hypothetical protein
MANKGIPFVMGKYDNEENTPSSTDTDSKNKRIAEVKAWLF